MALLITAPSYTGKTSMANLMYNYWQSQGPKKDSESPPRCCYISFAPLLKSSPNAKELDDLFKLKLGFSIAQIMNSEGYLITDETQAIFNTNELWEFWCYFKSGVQVRKVLSFAVFGLSRGAGFILSPAQYQRKWHYDDLKLTDEECKELVESFCVKLPAARKILIPEILGNVFQFVNNHPGLVYLSLYTLCYEFPRNPHHAETTSDFQTLIVKGQLLENLFQARCFCLNYDYIRKMLGERTDTIMSQLISCGSIAFAVHDDTLGNLNRSGMCISDQGQRRLYFSSEIMRVFYHELYYKALYGVGSSLIVCDWNQETMLSVLTRILELFQPQSFLNSLARGRNGLLYDRVYQDEFYRSCFLIAPAQCHPDVGPIYGSRGYLDFYIDSEIQLGFELLRNGNKLFGHFDRFNPSNGIYKAIPLRDYSVLDFYEHGQFPGGAWNQDNYYAAVFSQDFSTIQLWHKGIETTIVCGKNEH